MQRFRLLDLSELRPLEMLAAQGRVLLLDAIDSRKLLVCGTRSIQVTETTADLLFFLLDGERRTHAQVSRLVHIGCLKSAVHRLRRNIEGTLTPQRLGRPRLSYGDNRVCLEVNRELPVVGVIRSDDNPTLSKTFALITPGLPSLVAGALAVEVNLHVANDGSGLDQRGDLIFAVTVRNLSGTVFRADRAELLVGRRNAGAPVFSYPVVPPTLADKLKPGPLLAEHGDERLCVAPFSVGAGRIVAPAVVRHQLAFDGLLSVALKVSSGRVSFTSNPVASPLAVVQLAAGRVEQ